MFASPMVLTIALLLGFSLPALVVGSECWGGC
jgi:hypothetical protein